MADSPLHFTMRELQRLFITPHFWAALAGTSVILGLVGPFGTYDGLHLPARLAYWAAMAAASYLAGFTAVTFLAAWFSPDGQGSTIAFALYGAIAGMPVGVIVWAINVSIYGFGNTIELLPLTLYCIAISAVVSPLVEVFSRRVAVAEQAAQDTPAPGTAETSKRPRILDRLPANLRGNLSHLSMQDHYVDIRTDRGGTLVLMRLADAIAETEGVEGLRIHRSHWVAKDAVKGTSRQDGRLFLEMKDGTLLPVSRSYADQVKAAGLT
ncbi:MAG TPA: LytTR family DNA-binding domain-containing protein [Rhizobiaceae bacterium]|nr:LytTR family DNA-binding domain-containing protein [Rhizobiaceae bacterium]